MSPYTINSDTFHTATTGPTAPPQDFVIETEGLETLTFHWDPPPPNATNGLVVSYSLSCSPAYGPVLFVGAGSVNTKLEGFESDTTYTCSVFASTLVGDGPPAMQTATTPSAQENSVLVTLPGFNQNTVRQYNIVA